MSKIDRLGWAAGMAIESYGVKVGIRTNRPEVLGGLMDRLPPGWKPASCKVVEHLYSLMVGGNGPRPNIRRYNILYGNLLKLARTLDIDEVFDKFEADLQLVVAENTRRMLFVHAGVVGWRGRAILIAGNSFTGKSTLVKELLRAGATYYSDEYAVLDGRGRVHPFLRPIGIREDVTRLPKKFPVEEFGGVAGVKPLPVGLVVLSRYQSGARWRPRRLTPGQGALELLASTVPARKQPQAALDTLRKVVMSAPVMKGKRGEARETAQTILNFLEG